MEELLKRLLEAEVLSPETKTELAEAFQQHMEKVLAEAKEETSQEVRAELTEQWIREREVLIEAIDGKVGQFMESEIAELKADIDSFRDLEAEYAERIVEARAAMAEELKADMAKLLENLDGFLDQRLQSEFAELHEDIEEVRKNQFGRKIFEAYMAEFNNNFVDEDSIQSQLHEAQARLEQAQAQAQKLAESNNKLVRESKLTELLAPLNEYQKEVMGTILKTTPTAKLDETYSKFIGRILKESVDHSSEKESRVLAESEKAKQPSKKIVEESVVVKTGNTAEHAVEKLTEGKLSPTDVAALRRMSGIR